VVEFSSKNTNTNSLGAVTATDGKKWQVIDADGRTNSVLKAAIKHVVEGSSCDTAAGVKSFADAASVIIAQCSTEGDTTLDDVWQLVSESGESLGLAELSELVAGDSTCEALYATHVLLSSSVSGRARFKPGAGGAGFAPRSAAEAQRLLLQLQTEANGRAASDLEASALIQRFRAAMDGGVELDVSKESEATRKSLEAVKRLGCRAGVAARADVAEATDDDAVAFLRVIECKATSEAARNALVRLGIWDSHENLELIRAKTPTIFSDALEEEALQIVAEPPLDIDAARRLDLTHLAAYAIDSAATNEVDDAVSAQVVDDETWRIYVHVADATRYVALDSAIGEEAKRRRNSLYLPTGTIPMLPLQLAAGPLSLAAQQTSCALSFCILVDAATGEILRDEDGGPSVTISPSLVSVKRLTYAQVDDVLGGFPPDGDGAVFEALRRFDYLAQKRLDLRASQGSMESYDRVGLPDLDVTCVRDEDALDGWRVEVDTGDAKAGGPARNMVTELMILAGEAAARFGSWHEIPMPYRAQKADEPDDDDLDVTPPGPCTAWLVIGGLRGSSFCVAPERHFGLGLDAYVQVTSPIRRYADLVLHAQLKAFLRGDSLPFPDAKELCVLASGAANTPNFEKLAKNYWVNIFLKRNAHPLRALVLGRKRRSDDEFLLLLLDLGAIVDVNTNGLQLRIGQELEVTTTRDGDCVASKILT